jgi:hypothetical protein
VMRLGTLLWLSPSALASPASPAAHPYPSSDPLRSLRSRAIALCQFDATREREVIGRRLSASAEMAQPPTQAHAAPHLHTQLMAPRISNVGAAAPSHAKRAPKRAGERLLSEPPVAPDEMTEGASYDDEPPVYLGHMCEDFELQNCVASVELHAVGLAIEVLLKRCTPTPPPSTPYPTVILPLTPPVTPPLTLP